MDPTVRAFLTSWEWRLDVILVVTLLGGVYVAGWWRLRRQDAYIARTWRLALYLAGLAIICLSLLSPIDTFGSLLFFMHMIQHVLLLMLAPLLLLLADPLPVILWGLPRGPRQVVGGLLTRHAVPRRLLRALTLMPVAWLLYVLNLWVWHVPVAYEAALRHELIHDIEHLAFFVTALLFWWPITNPAPRVHGHVDHGLRIMYVIFATLQNTLLAALISLIDRVLYPYYTAVPQLWGLTPLQDQITGGLIMWIPGGMMYVITALVLVARKLHHEEQITRQHEALAFKLGGALE